MDGNQYVRTGGTWKVAELASAGIERCNIILASNQGESDAASLYGATVKVTNVDSAEVYYNGTWDGTEISLEFAPGVNYKVEVGAVADYATPEPKIFKALEQNIRNAVMTYQTEVVNVTLSSDNGVNVIGQIVTINGKAHTWDGSVITQKIPFGATYSISVDSKSGYISPSTQSFTANQSVRNVTFVYYVITGTLNPTTGVYIQATDGYCFTVNEWNNGLGRTPNGIAVVTDNCSFVLALDNISDYCEWAGANINPRTTLISGVRTVTMASEAAQDFDGINNTNKIVSKYNSYSLSSALECSKFIFPNGKKGYLGGAGEILAMVNNRDAINAAINTCGGNYISPTNMYWSSTQYDDDEAWCIYPEEDSPLIATEKMTTRSVRPFTSI